MNEKIMMLEDEMLMLVAGGFDDMDFFPEEDDMIRLIIGYQ